MPCEEAIDQPIWVEARKVKSESYVCKYLLEQKLFVLTVVRGSNPVIGKIYIQRLFTLKCIEKTKQREIGHE